MGYTAVVLIATAYSVDQQRSARKKQERANQIQRNQQEVDNRSARNRAERERRIRRARVLAQAEASGASTSSGVFGSLGSMDTNLGYSFAQQATQAKSADLFSGLQQDAQTNLFNAQMGEAVASMASTYGKTQ